MAWCDRSVRSLRAVRPGFGQHAGGGNPPKPYRGLGWTARVASTFSLRMVDHDVAFSPDNPSVLQRLPTLARFEPACVTRGRHL